MILARLEQADRYLALHPDFPAAIAFLRGQPLSDLPQGRIEIAGSMYALLSRSPARRRSEARLEAHRKYIDIQYVIAGVEEMGWNPRSRCRQPHGQYDAGRTLVLCRRARKLRHRAAGRVGDLLPRRRARPADRHGRGPQGRDQGADITRADAAFIGLRSGGHFEALARQSSNRSVEPVSLKAEI